MPLGPIGTRLRRLISADQSRAVAAGHLPEEPSRIPWRFCPACGGHWFCEKTFDRYIGSTHQTRSDSPPGRTTGYMRLTILMCLCGRFVAPQRGGIRGGRIPNEEILQFMKSVDSARLCMVDEFAPALGPEQITQTLTQHGQLTELEGRVAELEKSIGQAFSIKSDGRGRRGPQWKLPKRVVNPLSKGRDWLALELQKSGFNFADARNLVEAIFTTITNGLRDGKTVCTPIGEFRPARLPEPYSRTRFGRQQIVFGKRNCVRFTQDPKLWDDGEGEQESEASMQRTTDELNLRCDNCGSTHFTTAVYRQYLPGYSSAPGGELIGNDRHISLRTCLCGNHISADGLACLTPSERKDLHESLEKAAAYRSRTEVRRFEFEAVSEKVDQLSRPVRTLTSRKRRPTNSIS